MQMLRTARTQDRRRRREKALVRQMMEKEKEKEKVEDVPHGLPEIDLTPRKLRQADAESMTPEKTLEACLSREIGHVGFELFSDVNTKLNVLMSSLCEKLYDTGVAERANIEEKCTTKAEIEDTKVEFQMDEWNGIAPDGDDLWLRRQRIQKLLEKIRMEQRRLEKEKKKATD